jgi:hypothetical protein
MRLRFNLPSSIAVALLILALTSSVDYAQSGAARTSSGTRAVSPAVVATWLSHQETSGFAALDLLVLWRGTPEWFMKDSSKRTTGSGTGAMSVQHIRYGGLDLTLEFDREKRIAHIQGREIPLQDANVILVDQVDGPEGLQIIGARRVDPQFGKLPEDIGPILRRSAELVSYLRCDVRLPDAKVQEMMDLICARILGQ